MKMTLLVAIMTMITLTGLNASHTQVQRLWGRQKSDRMPGVDDIEVPCRTAEPRQPALLLATNKRRLPKGEPFPFGMSDAGFSPFQASLSAVLGLTALPESMVRRLSLRGRPRRCVCGFPLPPGRRKERQ